MRRLVQTAIVIGYLGIFVAWLFRTPESHLSALWMIDVAFSPLIIFGPILAAISATDSYVLRSGGESALVDSLSIRAQIRLHNRRAISDLKAVSFAILIALVVGQLIAALNDSVLHHWSVVFLVFPAAGMLIFYIYLGRAVGALLPFALVGPVLGILLYGLLAYLYDFFHVFYGFTGENVVVLSQFLAGNSLYFGLIYAAIGLAAFGVYVATIRRSFAAVAVSVIVFVGVIVVYVLVPKDFYFIRDVETYNQDCATLGSPQHYDHQEFTVCIPSDQKVDLPLIVDGVSDLLVQYKRIGLTDPPELFAWALPYSSIDIPFRKADRDEWQLPYYVLDAIACYPDQERQSDTDFDQFDRFHQLQSELSWWLLQDPAAVDGSQETQMRSMAQEFRRCSK